MQPRVLLAIFGAASGWGLAGVGTRILFGWGATTFTVIATRTAVATVAIAAFALLSGRKISREAWTHGAFIGFFRVGLASVFFIASLQYISAGVEALIITLVPLVTAVLGTLFLKERMRAAQTVGLVLGLAGTGLIIAAGGTGISDGSGDVAIGAALALLGVVFGSTSGVLSRHYAPRHETANLGVPMFTAGLATVTIAGLVVGDIQPSSVPSGGWLILVALGVGSTLVPFLGTLYASRFTSAARVALVAYLSPLISVIAGWLILDEVISGPMVVGGSLTLAGVALATRYSTGARQPSAASA